LARGSAPDVTSRSPNSATEQVADDPRRDHGADAEALRAAVEPARDVKKLRERYDATRFDFYSPEEVWALVRAAASEQDGAIFLTAAFTGLRRGS
jgi:integrase